MVLAPKRNSKQSTSVTRNTVNNHKNVKQTIILANTANIMSRLDAQNVGKTGIVNRGGGSVQGGMGRNSKRPQNGFRGNGHGAAGQAGMANLLPGGGHIGAGGQGNHIGAGGHLGGGVGQLGGGGHIGAGNHLGGGGHLGGGSPIGAGGHLAGGAGAHGPIGIGSGHGHIGGGPGHLGGEPGHLGAGAGHLDGGPGQFGGGGPHGGGNGIHIGAGGHADFHGSGAKTANAPHHSGSGGLVGVPAPAPILPVDPGHGGGHNGVALNQIISGLLAGQGNGHGGGQHGLAAGHSVGGLGTVTDPSAHGHAQSAGLEQALGGLLGGNALDLGPSNAALASILPSLLGENPGAGGANSLQGLLGGGGKPGGQNGQLVSLLKQLTAPANANEPIIIDSSSGNSLVISSGGANGQGDIIIKSGRNSQMSNKNPLSLLGSTLALRALMNEGELK